MRVIHHLNATRPLLASLSSYSEIKEAEDAGKEALATSLAEDNWQLTAAFHGLEFLSRQVEAIFAGQWAIVHGQGLHFWQGRQRWFRYIGDVERQRSIAS